MRKAALLTGCALALLTGCTFDNGAATNLAGAMAICARGGSHAEVRGSGIVVRYLGMRRTYYGLHEGFVVRIDGSTHRVEDNAGITGPIPLHAGEPIALQGQYECDDGVIHWTHHDPRLRHPPGYVRVGGTSYE